MARQTARRPTKTLKSEEWARKGRSHVTHPLMTSLFTLRIFSILVFLQHVSFFGRCRHWWDNNSSRAETPPCTSRCVLSRTWNKCVAWFLFKCRTVVWHCCSFLKMESLFTFVPRAASLGSHSRLLSARESFTLNLMFFSLSYLQSPLRCARCCWHCIFPILIIVNFY
jgi:hypothetical protein